MWEHKPLRISIAMVTAAAGFPFHLIVRGCCAAQKETTMSEQNKRPEHEAAPKQADVETAELGEDDLDGVSAGTGFSDMNIYQNGDFYTGGDISTVS